MPIPDLSSLSFDAILTIAVYLGLAGSYLLVIPAGLFIYLQKRWYVASSVERLIMYSMVFFFFPGMLAMSPFLNLRPERRTIDG